MSAEFNIRLHDFTEEAKKLGVARPNITREQVMGHDGVVTSQLTAESEKDWSNYLRAVNMAKLALRQ